MPALDALRDRLAELADLASLQRLAGWDQRTMMPPGGAPARAQQSATLERLVHDRATADDIGAWLEEIDGGRDGLGEVDADLVRLARRDWERVRRIPRALASDLALASAEGQAVWQSARAANDFAAFAPALRRNVDLARAYAACFDDVEHPYDALLADYDFGLTAARVREIFDPLAAALSALAAEAAERPAVPPLTVPIDAQRAAVDAILARLGVTPDSWRVDLSPHPFTSWVGTQDTRITTRYLPDAQIESILAAIHEFGHGLYERQIPPELARTNLGRGTSMSAHESQSKLWENHVGRHPAFAPVIAADLAAGGFTVDPDVLHRAITAVNPSLIRVSADPLTYPLHIVLRFHLEVALIEGSLEVPDLPAAWNDGMRRLLGRGGPRRRPRRPAGHALVGRRVRLLPELRARMPHRGAALGAARGRRRRPGRGAPGRRRRRDPQVAGRACPPPRPAARHGAACRGRHRARHRSGAVPPPRHALRASLIAGEDRPVTDAAPPASR